VTSAHAKLTSVKLAKGTQTDEQMLFDYPRRARAKDWFIRVTEIAPGGYVVAASDRWGRQVTHTGSEDDLERMIEDVERYAESVAAGNSK
jgi:hypothetical protein